MYTLLMKEMCSKLHVYFTIGSEQHIRIICPVLLVMSRTYHLSCSQKFVEEIVHCTVSGNAQKLSVFQHKLYVT